MSRKEQQRRRRRDMRNRTPGQKRAQKLSMERRKNRMARNKAKAKQKRLIKCTLKKGQRSKKLPASAGKYGDPNGWYCNNCTHGAMMATRKRYCESQGGKYNHSCQSCIFD